MFFSFGDFDAIVNLLKKEGTVAKQYEDQMPTYSTVERKIRNCMGKKITGSSEKSRASLGFGEFKNDWDITTAKQRCDIENDAIHSQRWGGCVAQHITKSTVTSDTVEPDPFELSSHEFAVCRK